MININYNNLRTSMTIFIDTANIIEQYLKDLNFDEMLSNYFSLLLSGVYNYQYLYKNPFSDEEREAFIKFFKNPFFNMYNYRQNKTTKKKLLIFLENYIRINNLEIVKDENLYMDLIINNIYHSPLIKLLYQRISEDFYRTYYIKTKNILEINVAILYDLKMENNEEIEVDDKIKKNGKEAKDLDSEGKMNLANVTFNQEKHDDILLKSGDFLTDKIYLKDPAIGRKKELDMMEIYLLSLEKSVLLIGEAGVGKTSLVNGLAYRIINKMANEDLQKKEIYRLNLNSLISGTIYRGQFEEKIENIIKSLIKNPNIILYIEEMHMAMGLGRAEKNNTDLANILKSYLSEGKIRLIGDTTEKEFQKYILPDLAFRRRFKVIKVLEPTKDVIWNILDSELSFLINKYNILFNFNENYKNVIFETLYNLTINASFIKEDGTCETLKNPDLILDILKITFSCAKFKNHKEIFLEDIILAINMSDAIPESRKEKAINILTNNLNSYNLTRKNNIIKLPR